MNAYKRHLWEEVVEHLWEESRFNTIAYRSKVEEKPVLVLDDGELAMLDALCEQEQSVASFRNLINKGDNAVHFRLNRFAREGWVRLRSSERAGGPLRITITALGREIARTPCESPVPKFASDNEKRRLNPTRGQGA